MNETHPASTPTPSVGELTDWLEGRLDDPAREGVVQAAVASDPATAELVAWLRRFLGDAARLPLVTPPPLLSQRLRALATSRAAGAREVVRVVAQRTGDSRRHVLPAGVRGSGGLASTRYQLTFAAPQAAVVVDVMFDGFDPEAVETVTLRGQVIAAPGVPPVFVARAESPSGNTSTTSSDGQGSFRLGLVPVDAMALVVSNDELEIRMTLDLPAGPR